MMEEEMHCTPPEVLEKAHNAINQLLPKTSKDRYENAYNNFLKWLEENHCNSFSESVLLAYFQDLSIKFKPSSLWAFYSMLRSTLVVKKNINIATYPKLKAHLKRQSDGYTEKKSKIFTKQEIKTFLDNAPDSIFLLIKAVMEFALNGALRSDELCKIKMDDIIEISPSEIMVKVPIVTGKFYEVYKKYANIRSKNIKNSRFFLNYQKGKCTNQVVGINKFSKMPSQIAEFLKLSEPKLYTGHSFRRTAATLFVDAEGDVLNLKRLGDGKARMWQKDT